MVPVPGYHMRVYIFGVFGSSKHPVDGDDAIIAISASATRDAGTKERRREEGTGNHGSPQNNRDESNMGEEWGLRSEWGEWMCE